MTVYNGICVLVTLALVALWVWGNHNNDDDNWPQPPAATNLREAW